MKSKTTMVNRIAITEARINLGVVVKRVRLNGEYFILEKDGIPIVCIMGADELEDYLELRDPKIQRIITRSAQDVRAGRTRPASMLLAEHSKADARETKHRASWCSAPV